jgi:chromosomal replication initiation ATPase DnaA
VTGEDRPHRKTRQLKFDFPQTGHTLDTLAITEANRTAIALLKRWPDWRTAAFCLVGPAGSGLTTAANAWCDYSGGAIVGPKALDKLPHKKVEALARGPVAVDFAEDISNEDNLLSLMNLSLSSGGSLLLTGHQVPARWRVRLPDLQSRLNAMTLIELGPPDDGMLSIRIRAAMRRRYLKLPEDVETFILSRIERSYTAVEDFVHMLHEMSDGREVTTPLAREILDQMGGTRALFEE